MDSSSISASRGTSRGRIWIIRILLEKQEKLRSCTGKRSGSLMSITYGAEGAKSEEEQDILESGEAKE